MYGRIGRHGGSPEGKASLLAQGVMVLIIVWPLLDIPCLPNDLTFDVCEAFLDVVKWLLVYQLA